MKTGNKFVFSIDVEDWFQVENLKSVLTKKDWLDLDSRVEQNTRLILNIFQENDIKATFFVLAWVAKRYPDLVREISNFGHEIASHGYYHDLLHNITESEIKRDIIKSKEILTPLAKNDIIGYRAPSFSIHQKAVYILKDLGFKYDASYNVFQLNERYGDIEAENKTDKAFFKLKDDLFEFPISSSKHMFLNIPFGGGYFRLFPSFFLKHQFEIISKEKVSSLYLHPWEFDPSQPKIKKINKILYFRHYYGLETTESKLTSIIKTAKRSQVHITTFQNVYASVVS